MTDNLAAHFKSWEETIQWLRDQPDRQALVRDGYYDDPLLSAAERYRCSNEWQEIRALLPSNRGTALDVGAGRGIATYALACEGFQVTSLEPDPSALVGAGAIEALARDAKLSIEITRTFSEQLPYPNATFDVVFARAVLHHMQDLSAACREFRRVLKPGGRLIAVREHVISHHEDLAAFLAIHPLHSFYGGENAFLLDEYRDAIVSAGLQIQAVLAPLETSINLSPHSPESFCRELVCSKLGGIGQVTAPVLSSPLVWALLRRALKLIDQRPGRLYSFVANCPP